MSAMSAESVEQIANVVLYEGYLLYPYSRSATKNQQRWTFGGVYPRRYSEGSGGADPWFMQTQCLVAADSTDAGASGDSVREATLEVKVRFLQVVDRTVAERLVQLSSSNLAATEPATKVAWQGTDTEVTLQTSLGNLSQHVLAQPMDARPAASPDEGAAEWRVVEELRVGEHVHRPWEEAIEREVLIGGSGDEPLRLGALVGRGRRHAFSIPTGCADEPLRDPEGNVVGRLVREWQALQGVVEIAAEPLAEGSMDAAVAGAGYRLTVRVVNTAPWTWPHGEGDPRSRGAALRRTLVSTHTILRVRGGAFVSLLEPPAAYQAAAEGCENVKTWPVLAGAEGERQTLLSSPIILYDYPQIAPETTGDLFETTEIDELLTLSIMTLTDEEKQAMRESDPRGRDVLERTEALTSEQLMKLHGAIRGLQPARRED